jgi:phage terminase large subunit-like protein
MELREEKVRRYDTNAIDQYYPDEGPLRRELYPKHLEFFGAGLLYRERCAMCANRVGKTEGMGGYETAVHLTGQYPDWWPGRRFTKPVKWWAAGKTNETTRDIVQAKLMGPMGNIGTGLIRQDTIIKWTRKAGVHDLMDTVHVKHISGGVSQLGLKSYQQGRDSFEGTEQDGIWDDEEPPMDIYGEQLIRTATTNGMVLITFTPLAGMSQVVLSFMPQESRLEV